MLRAVHPDTEHTAQFQKKLLQPKCVISPCFASRVLPPTFCLVVVLLRGWTAFWLHTSLNCFLLSGDYGASSGTNYLQDLLQRNATYATESARNIAAEVVLRLPALQSLLCLWSDLRSHSSRSAKSAWKLKITLPRLIPGVSVAISNGLTLSASLFCSNTSDILTALCQFELFYTKTRLPHLQLFIILVRMHESHPRVQNNTLARQHKIIEYKL